MTDLMLLEVPKETPNGHVFPLSIQSDLGYMQSIQVPTDDDLHQSPHAFFTSHDIWDASVPGPWHYTCPY